MIIAQKMRTSRPRQTIRSMLAGGDRRSIGRADEVSKLVEREPKEMRLLVRCLWDPDEVVRMRAADAIEKVSRQHASVLQRYKEELLGLAGETTQQEVRWHLAVTIPRLRLTRAEATSLAGILETYLEDNSSIVKTFAMQGLFDLTRQNSGLLPDVLELIRALARTGTAAMRARGRNLLKQIERG
jgi:hypothetical protein